MSGETIQVYTKQSVDALIAAVVGQIPAPLTRKPATATTAALAPQETGTITLSLGRAFLLFSASTSVPARVRLYSNSASRSADLARLATVSPTGEHGLILEIITTETNLFIDLAPIVWGAATDGAEVFASITNLSNVAQPISVSFTRLVLEV